jgi:hypothetical protein
MADGAIIAMDGSWSHRRNAMHCVVDFIDTAQQKIVDFEILEKQIGFCEGNYFGPSNGMEVEGVRRLIVRWKADPAIDAKVAGYVHDRDGKTRKMIAELWQKPEMLDPNHLLKSFDRKLDHHPLLQGLKTKLRRWFCALLRMSTATEEKIRLWRNTIQHFQGNHANCLPHPISTKPPPLFRHDDDTDSSEAATKDRASATPTTPFRKRPGRPKGQNRAACSSQQSNIELIQKKVAALYDFIDQTENMLMCVVPGITTQLCENFHSRKAKLATKDVSWRGSWSARVASAVLDVNLIGWRLQLYARLPLPRLSPEAETLIQSQEDETRGRRLKRQQPLERRKRAITRQRRRSYTQTIEKSSSQYKGRERPCAPKETKLLTHAKLVELLDSLISRDDGASEGDSESDPDWTEACPSEEEESNEEEDGEADEDRNEEQEEENEEQCEEESDEAEAKDGLSTLRATVDGLWKAADGSQDEYNDVFELPPDAHFDEVELIDL